MERYQNLEKERLREKELLESQNNQTNGKQGDPDKTINSKAQDLALSILEISTQDLNEILTGKDKNTGLSKLELQKIKNLEIEAELVKRGLENDVEWQEKFVDECRKKRCSSLHNFSQSLCKDLCDKVEELVELGNVL